MDERSREASVALSRHTRPLILSKPLTPRPRHGPRNTSWTRRTAPACRAGARGPGTADPRSSQSPLCCTARSYSRRCRWGRCRLRPHTVGKRRTPGRSGRFARGCSRWGRDLACRRCDRRGRVLVGEMRFSEESKGKRTRWTYRYCSPSRPCLSRSRRSGRRSRRRN